MRVDTLQLSGYRNYDTLDLRFSPEMNIIRGENAQGKTNLIEAIVYLSGQGSHRTRSDAELIGFDHSFARLQAEVNSRQRDFALDITLRRGAKRSILINGVKKPRLSALSEILGVVLFAPEDLSLVKEGAQLRRRFVDKAICQLRPKYAEALTRYQKLLDHKTRILRDAADKPSLLAVLEDFDEAMCRTGALLIHYRAHFIRRLLGFTTAIAADFSGGRDALSLRYETVSTIADPFAAPAVLYADLCRQFEKNRAAERAARSCLSGPHKDDLLAEISGKPARQFASQGQCRTIALSLKLSERALFFEESGQYPILLLDDVLSELDAKRQDFVLERIGGGQVFLSGCEIPHFKQERAAQFTVEGGRVL